MKNRYKISLLFLLLGFSSGFAQKKQWSLENCIAYAIEHNLQVKQQELNLEEAKITTNNAKGAFLPNLNGSIRNTWSNGLSENPNNGSIINQKNRVSRYGLSSEIPIYNGLRNYNNLQQAKLSEVATQFNIEKIKDDIKLNIANSYLQVLLQKENISILKAQYELSLKQLKQTNQLVESGNLPKGELLQLQATATNDLQRIAEAENSYVIANLGLKRLLNFDLSDSLEVKNEEMSLDEMKIIETSIDSIVPVVLKTRNEVKWVEKNVEVAKQGVKIAQGAYLPTVSGFVELGTNEQKNSGTDYFNQLNNNRGISAGLRLNIPILNRNRTKNGVARSRINVLQRENQLAQTKLNLTQDIYQAYLNSKASYKTYQASQKTTESQKLAFEYQQTRLDVGESNLLEYTQNKIRYQNSQTRMLRAKYDLLFRLKILKLYYNVN